MKQQTHDKLNVWRTRKKSEPQMGFEPTTLRDLVVEEVFVVSSLIYSLWRLVGCILICFNVTA